jgi:hypothetical protein
MEALAIICLDTTLAHVYGIVMETTVPFAQLQLRQLQLRQLLQI